MLDALVLSMNWWQWLIVGAGTLATITPYGRAFMVKILGFKNIDEGFETLILRAIMWASMVVLVFVAIDIGVEVFNSVLMALICVVVVLSNVALLAWTFRYRDDGKKRMSYVFLASWVLVFALTVAGSQTRLNAKLAIADAGVSQSEQLKALDSDDITGARGAIEAKTQAGRIALEAARERVATLTAQMDAATSKTFDDGEAIYRGQTAAGAAQVVQDLEARGADLRSLTRARLRADNAAKVEQLQNELSSAQADVSKAAASVAAAGDGSIARIDAAKASLRAQIEGSEVRVSSDETFAALAAILSFLWPFGVVTAAAAKALYTGLIAFAVDLVAAISTTALYHGVGSKVTKARREAWDDLTAKLDEEAAKLRAEMQEITVQLATVREEAKATPTPEIVERLRAMETAQEETRAKLAEVVIQRDDLAAREAELEAARRIAAQRTQVATGGAAYPRRAVEEAREAGAVMAAAPVAPSIAAARTVRPAVRPNGAAEPRTLDQLDEE